MEAPQEGLRIDIKSDFKINAVILDVINEPFQMIFPITAQNALEMAKRLTDCAIILQKAIDTGVQKDPFDFENKKEGVVN